MKPSEVEVEKKYWIIESQGSPILKSDSVVEALIINKFDSYCSYERIGTNGCWSSVWSGDVDFNLIFKTKIEALKHLKKHVELIIERESENLAMIQLDIETQEIIESTYS